MTNDPITVVGYHAPVDLAFERRSAKSDLNCAERKIIDLKPNLIFRVTWNYQNCVANGGTYLINIKRVPVASLRNGGRFPYASSRSFRKQQLRLSARILNVRGLESPR